MRRIQDIVAAIDFHVEGRAALARAEYLAKEFSASLHLVHGLYNASAAVSPDLSSIPESWDAERENAAIEMAKLYAELRSKGIDVITRVDAAPPVVIRKEISPYTRQSARAARQNGNDLLADRSQRS